MRHNKGTCFHENWCQFEKDKMCLNNNTIAYRSVNLLQSITGKLFGVVVIRPVVSHRFLTPGQEVCTEQAVEINQDHNIHHYHGDEEE